MKTMQLLTLTNYISGILHRGDYFEKHDVNGTIICHGRLTKLHVLAIVLGALAPFTIGNGFSDEFAGYTVGFLGIFVGLFASIVLSLYDKRIQILNEIRDREFNPLSQGERVEVSSVVNQRLIKSKNYLKQFTALTSVSILLAFFLIISLLLSLLFKPLSLNLYEHYLITDSNDISWSSVWTGFKLTVASAHRAVTIYLLTRFFLISLYSISSYFAFLNSQFKKL